MNIQIELVLLVVSILFFISIIVGQIGYKFGVPALLLFLAVGMLSGNDGLGIQFENYQLAHIIGTTALCIILFSGGLDTNLKNVRPVMKEGVVLATFGVIITALVFGYITWLILGMTEIGLGISFITSLLLASTIASTDSASVFSILRSRKLNLKNNLGPLLELESGSNDPMAYLLVITLIEIIKLGSSPDYLTVFFQLILQLAIGTLIGFYGGKLAVKMINKLTISNTTLYPILVFSICIFIFSFTYFAKGNGFLAVYIGGLVIGNSRFIHKRSAINFMDGLAWMSQLLMFLTLGLLVSPKELLHVAVPALGLSLLMIFVARPISVFLCLFPFRKRKIKDKMYISWVGLRGAVPIIFAIMPLAENIPYGQLIFNIVFFSTLVSLLIQGTTLAQIAKWLGLVEEKHALKKPQNFDIEFSDEIKSITTEITLNEASLVNGDSLMNLALPDQTLVVMVQRDDLYFVPTGKTKLLVNDTLLILTDNQELLQETIRNLGIEEKD